jgi:hypothetical protein
MAMISFLLPGSAMRAIDLLFEESFMSVLSDYSETAPGALADVLSELRKAGFRICYPTGQTDPEHQGLLICRGRGPNITAIAFIAMPKKLYGGGFAIDIRRFDKANRIDTFKVKPISSLN